MKSDLEFPWLPQAVKRKAGKDSKKSTISKRFCAKNEEKSQAQLKKWNFSGRRVVSNSHGLIFNNIFTCVICHKNQVHDMNQTQFCSCGSLILQKNKEDRSVVTWIGTN